MSAHRIYGVLACDAAVRLDAGSLQYGVYIELAPASTHAEPVVAHRDYGVQAAGHRAAQLAARKLRRDARVYVHCLGIGLGHTAGQEAAIRCVGVDFIELLDRPAPRHEPREPAHQAAIDPT